MREYLLENPETIFEAVEVFRQREAQAEAAADLNLVAANADAIFNDGFSYVGGNPRATSPLWNSWITVADTVNAPIPQWKN